ncbi:unnamed protein product [Nezara viridula]|uniref:Uncharacterized protein n=1 Tax=Nezara viridula TaxID=85310 RepID=A0A9P0DZ77_NEZVI|nr:unnamed protein product [Nezara viridula]
MKTVAGDVPTSWMNQVTSRLHAFRSPGPRNYPALTVGEYGPLAILRQGYLYLFIFIIRLNHNPAHARPPLGIRLSNKATKIGHL